MFGFSEMERTHSGPLSFLATVVSEPTDLPPPPPPLPRAGGQKPQRKQSTVQALFARVDARLDSLGYRAKECGGDGNCFFRVLAFALYNNSALHLTIRRKTVQHMRDKAQRYSAYVEGGAAEYPQYCARMAEAGAYIEGNLEILAAAEANNVNIHVLGDDERDTDWLVQNPNDETREVHIVHYDAPGPDCHYRAVEVKQVARTRRR